jgi:hypothetical protein
MTDNTSMKDGGGDTYTLRSKDISAAQDGSTRRSLVLSTSYPVDYGSGGCYQGAFKSAAMGAGLSAGSPIFYFRNTSASLLALLREVKLSAWSTGVGFTAGLADFELYVARGFTVADTGGSAVTLTGDNAQLRTSMNTSSGESRIGTLTAGTRVKDANTLDILTVLAPTGTLTPIVSSQRIFSCGDCPLILAQSEGI